MSIEPDPWWTQPRWRRALTLGGLWLSVALVAVIFRQAVLLVLGAVFLAYLLEPAIKLLIRPVWKIRLPRWIAILVIYAALFGAVYGFGRIAVPQLYGELARLGRDGRDFFASLTPERIGTFADRVDAWLATRGLSEGPLSIDVRQEIATGLVQLSETLRTHFFDLVNAGRQIVGTVLATVFGFFLLLMVTAFLSVDVERIKAFVFTMVPLEDRADFDTVMARIDQALSGVIRGQVIICLINGVLTYVGLVIIGVPFAGILSVGATVLYLVPIFGTIISSVPIVLLALAQGFSTGLAALGWIVGIHALEAYFLNPKILGRAARMHPVLVVFALIAGERTAGFVGALIAVPLMSIGVAVFRFFHRRAIEEPAKALPPPRAA